MRHNLISSLQTIISTYGGINVEGLVCFFLLLWLGDWLGTWRLNLPLSVLGSDSGSQCLLLSPLLRSP